ncbi:MAG: hypothetical protein MUF58_06875 [Arcicella sp.]|jgi:hypothetical protein|nr:hypothetical protein [Arcicella sp.]
MNNLFAPIYEFFYYGVPFSDDLYQNELYVPLGLFLIFFSLAMVFTFYYWINRPSFSRWYHWGIMLGINMIFQFGFAVIIPQNKFIALGIEEYNSEYYNFGLSVTLMALLMFVLFSFMLRWWSTNCRQTPFPN